jgi:phosphoglucosamine mutase
MITSKILHQDSEEGTPNLSLVQPGGQAIAAPVAPKDIFNLGRNIQLPNSPLFGTDGIRGKVGDLLTAELALQVGFWAGLVLKSLSTQCGPIILGQDSRNSSDMLAMAVSAGLTSAGLDVWNLGLCPTPCVSYLTSISEAIGGVMISASHNPPGDNGIKFFGLDGTKLSGVIQKQIEAGIRGQSQLSYLNYDGDNDWGRYYDRRELVKDYVQSLQGSVTDSEDLQPLRGLRIVLDLAWGAACQLAPAVFEAMGAEVIALHEQPDGDRINVNCGSTHLRVLEAAVKEADADLGFAFDGDADRSLAVDGQGRPIDGDYILYLWGKKLREIGKLPGDTIVATVMSNLGFERAWEKLGGKLVRTSVGDRYVHAEMERSGAKLGGEQSGHIICPDYSITGDGLMTALQIANLVGESGLSLAELRDQSFQTYPQLLRNVRVEDRDRRLNWQKCEAVQKAIALAETEMGDRGRVLVRASGTEPVIRVMVEAATEDMAESWTEHLVQVVQTHLAA